MPRTTISRPQLLRAIVATAGDEAGKTAAALLDFARDLGAEQRARQNSISVRFPGPVGSTQKWLTLYVVSSAGTFYTNWLYRWVNVGASKDVAHRYETRLRELLGPVVHRPTAYRKAVRLSLVAQHLEAVKSAALTAVVALRPAIRRTAAAQGGRASAVAASPIDIENILRETRVPSRKRSRRLRAEALKRAAGVCATCMINYGTILGGRGFRALQVHHRRQLAATDTLVVTAVEDLAVVCANCHALIHSDQKNAIAVDDLHAMLAAERKATGNGEAV